MAQVVHAGLVQMNEVIGDMNVCHGCPEQSGIVQSTAVRWMTQLNRVYGGSAFGNSARSAGFEAFRNYAYAAQSFKAVYFDNLYSVDDTDDYNLYVRQYRRAQSYAQKAVRLLAIQIPTIP